MVGLPNFRRRENLGPVQPPAVDLDDHRQWPQIVPLARGPDEFAPRQQMADIDRAVLVVTSFGELPTKEMDDAIFALEEELAVIKDEAQRVRNAYVEVTDRLRRHIEKQKAVHKIARTAFSAMATQCAALDREPELPFVAPPPAAPVVAAAAVAPETAQEGAG